MRKRFSFVLLFLCSMALLYIAANSLGEKRFSQLYVDTKTWEQLISDREEYVSREPIFHALYLNGYKQAYDCAGKMILYSLIENSALADDPQIKVSSPKNDVKVALLGNPISEELIRKNESIGMMFYTDDYYEIYELKCTTLPVIQIEISPMDIPKEDVHTRFVLFDNRKNILNRVVDIPVLIHLRGNHQGYPKQDYRISLQSQSAGKNLRNYHLSLLGLRQDEDWILKGQFNDEQKIREVFSTKLWYDSCSTNHEFEIVNGTQYRMVEVFVGQEYRGVYGICSPIDAKQLEIKTDEHYYAKSYIYPETEINFNETGELPGYEYRGIDFENPDWEPLRHYYRVLFDTKESHASDLYEITDVKNAIDIFLFLNLIQGVDHAHIRDENSVYNLFFSAKKSESGEYKILYTPWDMDRTWGMALWDKIEMDPSYNVVIDTSIVTRLLEMGDVQMAQMVVERYRQLRENQWSNSGIREMIGYFEKNIIHSGAFDRDYQKWHAFRGLKHRESYDDFSNHVYARLEYMDDYVASLAEEFGLEF